LTTGAAGRAAVGRAVVARAVVDWVGADAADAGPDTDVVTTATTPTTASAAGGDDSHFCLLQEGLRQADRRSGLSACPFPCSRR
jgi:hypothetical protein